MPVSTIIRFRRGLAAAWTATNPILVEGEVGYETDTFKIKIGNGTTAWNALPYNLGFSGWSGYSGTSGWSGKSGISGWSGQGTSGWSGKSGISGWSGIVGPGATGGSGSAGSGCQYVTLTMAGVTYKLLHDGTV